MMTAALQEYDIADFVVVKPVPRYRRVLIAGVVALGIMVALLGLVLTVPALHEDVVAGAPTANHEQVVAAAADRKAAADAAALQSLEVQVAQGMQTFLDNPSNNAGWSIKVINVMLIKVSDTKYEGMATMQVAGHQARQVAVHVTATADTAEHGMWATDPGALLPLFW